MTGHRRTLALFLSACALTWLGRQLAEFTLVPAKPAGAQAHSPVIYLPLSLRSAPRAELPRASTAVPTPEPSATSTPEPSPTPEPCGPLVDRVSVSSVSIAPRTVRAQPERRVTPAPLHLVELPAGGVVVGWSDHDGQVHLTPLNDSHQRSGPDISLEGESIRGLVAHTDGYAALVVRGDEMHLVRLDESGGVVFDKRLVGGVSQTVTGNKWVDNWGHEGRLVWAEERYGAYFGHTQFFGQNGRHQGDLLWYFDADGERITGRNVGWDWGCSHSLDVRLTHNSTRFGPVCLSDAYPSKAFHFNHRTAVIRSEPSGDERGFSAANLGGLVPLDGGFLMSFTSPEGRRSSDVGLIRIGNDGAPSAAMWLTDTPTADESAPHLARYGPERLLAGWRVGAAHFIAEVTEEGELVSIPTPLEATINPRDDFTPLANGDVAWAHGWDNLSELKVVRVGWCELEAGRGRR